MTHDAETVERMAKAIYEVDVSQDAHPECMPNWEDIHACHDEYKRKARAALSTLPPQEVTSLLDPDMPDDQMRLHAGEITAQEIRTARALIRLANAKARSSMSVKDAAKVNGPDGILLPQRYHAFIWTGGPDQEHDPIWMIDYLKAHKAYIVKDSTGVYIKGLPGRADVGDVIVFNGRDYSADGGVSFWSPIAFEVHFGTTLRAISEGE